jgi:hypothetical protein
VSRPTDAVVTCATGAWVAILPLATGAAALGYRAAIHPARVRTPTLGVWIVGRGRLSGVLGCEREVRR